MQISDKFELAPGVLILSAGELDQAMRAKCACEPEDFVVSRARSRSMSRVVSQDVSLLLQRFRQPSTIVAAVLDVCGNNPDRAQQMLEPALKALSPFIQAQWIINPDANSAPYGEPSLLPGDCIDRFRVIECRHLVEDTELFQCENPKGQLVALKLAADSVSDELEKQFSREARILRHVQGHNAPTLQCTGRHANRPFLAMSWFPGVSIEQLAQELRQLPSSRRDEELLDLCRKIVSVFADLHTRRVVHGDVHPSNILTDSTGQVTVIDFGMARIIDGGDFPARRKGVPDYFEPEYASSILASSPRPEPSFAGEQYAVAAMLYQLVTGQSYLSFSVFRDEMLAQIVLTEPRLFVDTGRPAWPSLENVLRTALSKDPRMRFSSLDTLQDGLRAVQAEALALKQHDTVNSHEVHREALGHSFDLPDLTSLALPESLPTASITHGCAGIALGLLGVSLLQNSSALLALADAWSCRAVCEARRHNAFFSTSLQLDSTRINETSVFYGRAGIPVTQAFVARAMGDARSFTTAITALGAMDSSVAEDDLTMGRAGLVTALALLLDNVNGDGWLCHDQSSIATMLLRGRENVTRLSARVCEACQEGNYLGVAHGRAGMLYAILLWSAVTNDPLAHGVTQALEELKDIAQVRGRGLSWPTRFGPGHATNRMESWCHGSPGFVHLWTLSSLVLRNQQYLETAEKAAWTAWEDSAAGGTLCCGLTGRAYALLNVFRHTGDSRWVDRALSLIDRAVASCAPYPEHRYSLFQGSFGAIILASSKNNIEQATFPLFERAVSS